MYKQILLIHVSLVVALHINCADDEIYVCLRQM